MNEKHEWKKIKTDELIKIEKALRDMEKICVGACDRFINFKNNRDSLWILCGKKRNICAFMLNSKSALFPFFFNIKEIPQFKYLKKLAKRKKVHSIQGKPRDVIIMEKEMNSAGIKSADVFDYDLMALDHLPLNNSRAAVSKLIIREPDFEDINELLPLRKGYEEEEVLPTGGVFIPDAGKLVLANFISKKRMLIAEYNGKIAGTIAVNGAGFSRCQIGGVYTLPEFRGMGIASCLAGEFVKKIINEGKGISLFVKKNNIPAKKLYLRLGFKYIEDYRIAYY